ncbi:MAG: NADH-quinone oxidoreductase subunit N [Zetaproteobacteria bacterium]|nr:MAG: NADH-quinone oxidoreductase subunit N [Zetaproteobacteria bacterium]
MTSVRMPENLWTLGPEMALAVWAMALLVLDLFVPKGKKGWTNVLAVLGVVVAAVWEIKILIPDQITAFYGFFVHDPLAVWGKLLALFGTVMVLFIAHRHVEQIPHGGEFAVLVLFATLGLMLMISANNFVIFYLGLELASIAVYVLVGYLRGVLRSAEAGVKYLVLGALSSGMLLYGMSFLYGLSGSFMFADIGKTLGMLAPDARLAAAVGLVFVVAGLAFKVSAAPFHMWTPDAYEGAPTPITAYLSTAMKLASFIVFIRFAHEAVSGAYVAQFQQMIAALAAVSMIVGNIAAIAQRNIKRMLAYSTIGHVGFVLLGLLSTGPEGYAAILTYFTIYLVMGIAAFAVVDLLAGEGFVGEAISEYAGLARVRPGYAVAMGLVLFSLAGIPFLAGFWAKYYVFLAAVQAGWVKLVVLAVVMSVVGAFYYIRVVKVMFFDAPREGAFAALPANAGVQAVVAFGALFVTVFGLYPAPIVDICRLAVAMLL